jgi:hypothetical protein
LPSGMRITYCTSYSHWTVWVWIFSIGVIPRLSVESGACALDGAPESIDAGGPAEPTE